MNMIKITNRYAIHNRDILNYQIAEWEEAREVRGFGNSKETRIKEAQWVLKESFHPNIEQALSKIIRLMIMDSADKGDLDSILDVIKEMNNIHDTIIEFVVAEVIKNG